MSSKYCMDCQADTYKIDEYYMIRKTTWLRAVPDKKGMLCIGCLETRLGRKLNKHDFINAPINCHMCSKHSIRLLDRMGW